MPKPLTAPELRAHLLSTGVAGRVSGDREKVLRRCRQFAAGDPRALLGLEPARDWSPAALLALLAEACGEPAATAVNGPVTIDPDRTIRALDRFAARLGRAAAARGPVLLGTGHPGGLLEFYAGLAAGLRSAGCPVLTPGDGERVDMTTRFGVRAYGLSYVRGVALVHEAGAREGAGAPGAHTHSPLPVRVALGAAAACGGPLPALVIGDHGWLCGAGQLGFEAMGPADADDPAVFVGEAEGQVVVAVPLDDAVRSECYRPLTRYVLNQACLSQ